MTADLPPFLAAVSDQIWRDFPPEVDNTVTKGNSPIVTGLQTFHVIRHQERKWHNPPSGGVLWAHTMLLGCPVGLSDSSAQILRAVEALREPRVWSRKFGSEWRWVNLIETRLPLRKTGQSQRTARKVFCRR